jgi:glutathione S-transferase
MKLIVSNKATSPWPFRAWLALRYFDIPFELEVLDLKLPNKAERLKAASPSGRLPILIDSGIEVWESLAIIEYAAERFPDKAIWPKDVASRAHARAIANEMHAGFAALRKACVFNMNKAAEATELDAGAQADVARIVEIWTQTRRKFAGNGPFLFGEFSAADAMYAPVVSRLHTYRVPIPAEAHEYMKTMMALPVWTEWEKGD